MFGMTALFGLLIFFSADSGHLAAKETIADGYKETIKSAKIQNGNLSQNFFFTVNNTVGRFLYMTVYTGSGVKASTVFTNTCYDIC